MTGSIFFLGFHGFVSLFLIFVKITVTYIFGHLSLKELSQTPPRGSGGW